MRTGLSFIGCLIALLCFGCAHHHAKVDQGSPSEQFVGTSPGGMIVREFIGGLPTNAACDSIQWSLTLSTNHTKGGRQTFALEAAYQVPVPTSPNHSQAGPKANVNGTWELITGGPLRPRSTVYRLNVENPRRSLSFVKVSDGLLHLLNADGSLAIGNSGQSYTLNRKERTEEPGDRALAMTAPSITYKIAPVSTGPDVFGVFEGRTPCLGISRELNQPRGAECIKSKWRVTLYQNPETRVPTTYKVEGSLFRDSVREGTWSLTKGTVTDANATVYQLAATPQQSPLLLMKGDDNVLFFLNQKREPLIGHSEFSYTLNRAAAK
jgi:hypothetical protein